jgi:hypothetical protein
MKAKKCWILAVILLMLSVILTGCTACEEVRSKNRERLLQLSVGMTKEEVLDITGRRRIHCTTTGASTKTINNPYSSEMLVGKNKTLEVLYYYTDRKHAGFTIRDEDLTPVVFDDDRLIGWGWNFLNEQIERYEMKFRRRR